MSDRNPVIGSRAAVRTADLMWPRGMRLLIPAISLAVMLLGGLVPPAGDSRGFSVRDSAAAQDRSVGVTSRNLPREDAGTSTPYTLNIEVLIQPQPSDQLRAREWGMLFQELGYTVSFRGGRPGEKLRVENLEATDQRITHVVGNLEKDGRLAIVGQRFQLTNPEKLDAYLQRLVRFGAAGPVSESPTWGLTDQQLSFVNMLLSARVDAPVSLTTPVDAIGTLGLPEAFQVRFTAAAKDQQFVSREPGLLTSESLAGVSKGTALAIVLSQAGLGFRPLLENRKTYVLEIDVGGESSNLWPVGWKSKQPLNTLLPDLYRSIPVDVEDVVVSELVQAVSEKLEIRPFYAAAELGRAGVNPSEMIYSRKPDKLAPSRLLSLIGDRFQLGLDVRVDESGQCFLWVTTAQELQAFRRRFAHIVPGKP